jgi:hypothetical protein
VGHGVGVGVAEQPLLERDALAAEDERPARREAMGVVAETDPDQAATSAGSSMIE